MSEWWLPIGALVALLAAPLLLLRAKRAFDRGAAASLEAIYRRADQASRRAAPDEPVVALRYHTYSGILFYVDTVEHSVELPYPAARQMLEDLFQHSLKYGFFAYGAALIPSFAYLNCLGQRRSLRKQAAQARRAHVQRPMAAWPRGGDRMAVTRPARSGLERWGGGMCIGLIAAGLLAVGAEEVREARVNPEARALSCLEAAESLPLDVWVRVTGATGDVGDGLAIIQDGVIRRVYVPLRCDGDGAGPARLLLSTGAPLVVSAARTKREVRIERVLEGMVRGPEHDDVRVDRSRLEGRCAACGPGLPVASEYAVIVDGATPSSLRGFAMLVGGVVVGIFTVRHVRN